MSGGQTVILVSNTYDSTSLTNVTTLREHDAAYGTGFAYRGNLTTTTPVGGPTTTLTRDITGNMVSATDGLGHTISTSVTTATNYAVPDRITPNNNTDLQQTITYTPSLALASLTNPNTAIASATYDLLDRPSTTTSVYGAVTTYTYSLSGTPAWQRATTNNHWVQTSLDGFNRPITELRGHNVSGGATVSQVDTTYGPCACSPLGKVTAVSQPRVPGGTAYWTQYTYDGLGRTVSMLAPDGASTTTYAVPFELSN